MLRFAAGAGSALLLMLGGFFIWQSAAQSDSSLTAPEFVAPEFASAEEGGSAPDEEGPAVPPAADARTKEQRRFDRADKDKNGAVALEELFQPRRKAFARLEEWRRPPVVRGMGGAHFDPLQRSRPRPQRRADPRRIRHHRPPPPHPLAHQGGLQLLRTVVSSSVDPSTE